MVTIPVKKIGIKAAPKKRRSRTPEGKVVDEIYAWLDGHPTVWKVNVVQAGSNGVPDILMCMHGILVAVEAKAPGQSPRANQEQQLRAIEEAGGVSMVLEDTNTVATILDETYRRIGRWRDNCDARL